MLTDLLLDILFILPASYYFYKIIFTNYKKIRGECALCHKQILDDFFIDKDIKTSKETIKKLYHLDCAYYNKIITKQEFKDIFNYYISIGRKAPINMLKIE